MDRRAECASRDLTSPDTGRTAGSRLVADECDYVNKRKANAAIRAGPSSGEDPATGGSAKQTHRSGGHLESLLLPAQAFRETQETECPQHRDKCKNLADALRPPQRSRGTMSPNSAPLEASHMCHPARMDSHLQEARFPAAAVSLDGAPPALGNRLEIVGVAEGRTAVSAASSARRQLIHSLQLRQGRTQFSRTGAAFPTSNNPSHSRFSSEGNHRAS